RKPIAIKFMRTLEDLPADVKAFGSTAPGGTAKSMLCAMWGDAFSGAGPFYTVASDHICGGGAIAAGFGSPMPVEAAAKFMIGEQKVSGTLEGLKKAMAATLPFADGEFAAQVIGPLEKMPHADLVFIVCKPFQGQHILRAYGYDTGDVVYGIGGTSTCEMVSSYVMKTGRPTFTLGDLGGNTGLGLDDDDVILAFPDGHLETAVKNLLRIARDSTMYKHHLYHEPPAAPRAASEENIGAAQ
ncbi:MAG: DUF169 domain-containing protein, partial [Rhizobacter sp.]|nr:DUF169 domain-containing protein [Chlorobiales bacterium]